MGKWAVTLIGWLAASLWWPPVYAAEDNLYFSGTLVNEPCVLAEEDNLIKLDFNNVVNKELYLNGRTKGLPIKLRLKNCDLDVGNHSVNITFSGDESSEPPGFLVLQSATVKGLMVGLETTTGTALPLNQTHSMGELTSGNTTLNFNAYLQGEPEALASRTLGEGEFAAALTFALSYE